jgi:hypothetical protein
MHEGKEVLQLQDLDVVVQIGAYGDFEIEGLIKALIDLGKQLAARFEVKYANDGTFRKVDFEDKRSTSQSYGR